MQVKIQDDFCLEKIRNSGQCFRVKKLDDNIFRFITGNYVIYIKESEKNQYTISCNEDEWENVWTNYFDLKRNYQKLREGAYGKHDFIQQALDYGQGLRILRQDPWEILITFIVSQRKNIPSIAKVVEVLARRYGHIIKTTYEEIFTFPAAEDMYKVTEEELRECGLGYRAPYVRDAIEKVNTGSLNLQQIAAYDDEHLLKELLKIHGVGQKIANCVCLFGYGRTGCVPIDVWISRAIQEECHGKNPFPMFQNHAGIIQQYVFYHKKHYHL